MSNSHRTLYRYITREFLKILGLSLSSLVLIYVIVVFLQKMNVFHRYQAPFYLIFEYLFYKLPEVTFQWTLPYAVLLSVLLTLGALSRHSEITALKAGGISLYRITLPLFFVVFLISVVNFLGKRIPRSLSLSEVPVCLGRQDQERETNQFLQELQDLVPERPPDLQHSASRPSEKDLKGLHALSTRRPIPVHPAHRRPGGPMGQRGLVFFMRAP